MVWNDGKERRRSGTEGRGGVDCVGKAVRVGGEVAGAEGEDASGGDDSKGGIPATRSERLVMR